MNPLRLEYAERARGLGLHILFNTTVTADNLQEIPALARFFIDHADVIHLASFQVRRTLAAESREGRRPG